MSDNKNDFINLLYDLCQMYIKYISNNIGSRLKVLIQDNKINMCLYNEDVIDTFELSFNKKESDMYLSLSIIVIKILFGNCIMYNKDNMIYNDDKPYLEIFVNDDNMLNKIFNAMVVDRKKYIYHNESIVNKKIYSRILKERICLSKKLLGMDDK